MKKIAHLKMRLWQRPTLIPVASKKMIIVIVLRLVVLGCSSWLSWQCQGCVAGAARGTVFAAAPVPRQAALDSGFVIHQADKKVIGGVAPVHHLRLTDWYFFKSATLTGR
jgi:hypothetical protein